MPSGSGPRELRFVCDQDIDAAVAATLRRLGHEAWTAANAGLSAVGDDELTVYADKQSAVLLTHDVEFSQTTPAQRRRQARLAALRRDGRRRLSIEEHIHELVDALSVRKDVWVRLSAEGLSLSFAWT